MAELPTGTVTFMFTDVEGSTRLLHELGDAYGDVQADHFRLMREAVAQGDGVEIRTEGDAFFVVFRTPTGALAAAAAAQRDLTAHRWPHGGPLRVRIGLHTGEGKLGGDDYLGIDVNRAARIAAAGHGGQVVLSSTTAALVERDLPDGVTLRDLGAHRLKDFGEPEHLHQLVIHGLPDEFPALKTLDGRPTNLPTPRTSFIGRTDEVAAVAEAVRNDRLVTLTGPGATGKTRLALQVAAELLEELPDGAFFVDLSPIRDADLVGSAVAEALKVMEEPRRPLLDALADHLRDRELLVVLDNFEQVTEAAGVVERLLEAAPRVRVLVTSREPLHLSGERELPVPPLDLPDPLNVPGPDVLSQFEAVALFMWFESAPLTEDLRIAGTPRLSLHATSSGTSTHFTPVLFDLGPPLTQRPQCRFVPPQEACTIDRGFLNARYRDGLEEGKDLVPGQPYQATVRFIGNDWVVPAGNRIGLAVMSSNLWWAVPDDQRSTNTLISEPGARTALVLPVVGGSATARAAGL